jgi:hypothetical protein
VVGCAPLKNLSQSFTAAHPIPIPIPSPPPKALRFDNWKFVFCEQRCPGTLQVWAEPYVQLRVPKIFNLRTDPYERADITSNTYWDWVISHAFLVIPAQAYVAQMMASLVEFPPRQKPASFSIDQLMEKLKAGMNVT